MEHTHAETREQIQYLIDKVGRQVTASGESVLLSWSVPWEASSLIPFLYHARGAPRLYWASSREEVSFAGYGVAAMVTASGPRRFRRIREKSQRLFENLVLLGESRPDGVIPRLFGGFGFDPDPDPLSIWGGFGAARFILPRYLLSRNEADIWLTINHHLRPEDDLEEIIWLFTDHVDELVRVLRNNFHPYSRSDVKSPQVYEIFGNDETAQTQWHTGIENAIQQISSGGIRKVVLARSLTVKGTNPLDPADALLRLGDQYPDCYRFLFEPVSGRAFFGATPELLVSVSKRKAQTVALAGSARRGQTEDEDRNLAETLMSDPKELQEHAFVVNSISKRLAPFAKGIHGGHEPGIRKLNNIQHLETPIDVELKKSYGVLSLVEALHPTPAVGGVPQNLALKIINNTEPVTRGWYASPVGWIDHRGDGLFTVGIRSAVSVGDQALLYAGAGIVSESDPNREWRETGLKFKPMLDALETSVPHDS